MLGGLVRNISTAPENTSGSAPSTSILITSGGGSVPSAISPSSRRTGSVSFSAGASGLCIDAWIPWAGTYRSADPSVPPSSSE
ncbi:MAG TPA: hypothetical protein VF796_19745 [Humisphaera sp.]